MPRATSRACISGRGASLGATGCGRCPGSDANCGSLGCIVRYPQGAEAVTGYIWEPWHIRYVGIDIATHNRGMVTPEEYLGAGPARGMPAVAILDS